MVFTWCFSLSGGLSVSNCFYFICCLYISISSVYFISFFSLVEDGVGVFLFGGVFYVCGA